ncbi:YHS domain-containing protein [Nocardia africana]|uniref:propane 2-monooxygenase n=1 Tax=Nocardia africana TaxID=134964 RepID=A0A378WW36_9NOCA|nr:YHS domain-containing protein [Nocardia africana]MCC3313783.1 YHS domain-containing protein [Nocardia africana]SUA44835.1 Toluene-4-monooxygenase system protein A [Nocardia africana]
MAKASMKERYRLLTRDLDWKPSYVTEDELYPYTEYEGIKIHDWDAWEDPFRLTVDAYSKYQAEKDKRLYAAFDSFAQGQGHLQLTDARYLNSVKIFLQGITPNEYYVHRHFSYIARHLNGPGPRCANLYQSIDELRHAQTETHALSMFNKYYSGFHSPGRMYDRVWYNSVPKSFFDDAVSGGPFEFLTAISFSFEYFLTNLLFVPFMSGASYNGDLSTMSFGFSAQSDESRHMTLGLEVIKFILEQDEVNVPIMQDWIDKWFWRGYRLLGIVAMMQDYMLPRKVMSWKEAWELYLEQQMLDGLFPDLAYYGIRPPMGIEQAIAEKDYVSHQVHWIFYQFSHAAGFTTTVPPEAEMDWLSAQYPATFDRYYRPLYDKAARMQAGGNRFFNGGLPTLCQVCQIPCGFSPIGDPSTILVEHCTYEDERYNFCSDGCRWIFEREPKKYIQAWLPVHQIYQGNCGGPTMPEVFDWWGLEPGDSGEYTTSRDASNWAAWHEPTGARA